MFLLMVFFDLSRRFDILSIINGKVIYYSEAIVERNLLSSQGFNSSAQKEYCYF